ncbi:MAG TPA: ABC transporter substrate-binding protein [Candidatus Limnocylindria bacterium]|nr:ABC transporter substrate-binding protein [Candidatus Limnocylindria bacterium]
MRRISPRRLGVALAALLLAACTLAPGPDGPAAPSPSVEPEEVTLLLGFRPDVQFAPFYVAQQEGYYAAVGLEVTIEHRQSPDVIRLVASGQAEFGVADATDVMVSRTSEIPVVYAASLFSRFPVAIIGPAGEVPAEPAGLGGTAIGTPGRFGSSWHALLALLDAGGLDEEDVTIREYPQFNQAEGLANGDVELITGFRNNEPLRLAARGMEVDLLTLDEWAPLPGPGLIVGDELLARRREMVRAFAEATLRAQREVIADTEVGLAAAERAVPAIAEDRETARAVLEATAELWGADPAGEIDPQRWESGYGIMTRLGFIDGSVPLDEMIARDLLD